MKVIATYVLLTLEVVIENEDKGWRGTLEEVNGIGYTNYFKLVVHGKQIGELHRRDNEEWKFITNSGKGLEIKDQLVYIVEQFLKMQRKIKLTPDK